MKAYIASFCFGIRQATRDRVETLGGLIIYALLLTIFSTVFAIMPLNELPVVGLTAAKMLWYFAVTECIIMGCPGLARFGSEIGQGKLTEFMQRPTHVAGFVLSRMMGFHLYVSLLLIVAAVIALPLLFDAALPLALVQLPLFLLSLFLGILLMEMMGFILGAFELLGPYSRPISWVVGKLIFALGGLFFPVSCFPPLMAQLVLLTPFPSVIFYPAQFMLTNDWAVLASGVAQQLLWVGIMYGVVLFAHQRMMQRVLQQGD